MLILIIKIKRIQATEFGINRNFGTKLNPRDILAGDFNGIAIRFYLFVQFRFCVTATIYWRSIDSRVKNNFPLKLYQGIE